VKSRDGLKSIFVRCYRYLLYRCFGGCLC